jgi:hypothetical protein
MVMLFDGKRLYIPSTVQDARSILRESFAEQMDVYLDYQYVRSIFPQREKGGSDAGQVQDGPPDCAG